MLMRVVTRRMGIYFHPADYAARKDMCFYKICGYARLIRPYRSSLLYSLSVTVLLK
jgi:hypothetical protein